MAEGSGESGHEEDDRAVVPVATRERTTASRRVRAMTRSLSRQRGMVTAEYAVGAVAAAGFAGVLIKVLTDPHVFELLLRIISWLLGLVTGQKIL